MFGKSGTAEIPLGGAPKGKKAPRGSKGYFEQGLGAGAGFGGLAVALLGLVTLSVVMATNYITSASIRSLANCSAAFSAKPTMRE